MIYGIDLGTTNSLIGLEERLLSTNISSTIDLKIRKNVREEEWTDTTISSYKTNMTIGEDGKLSVVCSSIMLKTLVDIANEKTGFNIKSIVVSVPAYFSTSQREAVYKAAKIAELDLIYIINEPTAAALYVCKELKGVVVIYDLGGGTFDISIVDSRTGNYEVIATDGIVLGGDNLDSALAEEVILSCRIPIRYLSKTGQNKLNRRMRLAKEEIQRTKSFVSVELKDFGIAKEYQLTEAIYKRIVKKVFGKTLNIVNNVISSNVSLHKLSGIIFVGGSTKCPYLIELVKENIGLKEIRYDLNPDLVVAKGVCVYAGMVDRGEADLLVKDVTKRLCIEENTGNSITIIERNTVVPCMNTIIVTNPVRSEKISINLYQGDSLLVEKNTRVGKIEYQYNRMVEPFEGSVEIIVEVKRDGVIYLRAAEVLYGERSSMSIKLRAR